MKIIKVILVILWCLVIFLFSNMTSSKSNGASTHIIEKVISISYKIINKDISYEEIKVKAKKLNKPLRKCMHAFVYFILALLLIFLIMDKSFDIKKSIIILILCFIFSLTDEYHQLFINGRTAQFIDCLIDTSGSLFALVLYYLLGK